MDAQLLDAERGATGRQCRPTRDQDTSEDGTDDLVENVPGTSLGSVKLTELKFRDSRR